MQTLLSGGIVCDTMFPKKLPYFAAREVRVGKMAVLFIISRIVGLAPTHPFKYLFSVSYIVY